MRDSADHVAMDSSQYNAQISDFGLDEIQMNRFHGVLRVMNLKAIPAYASRVRQFGHRSTNIISFKTFHKSGSVPCKVVDVPLSGSYHIVFTIEFDDGIKWMLKISANGHHFDSIASAALISEARTMQLIATETTIPVPVVYAFDTSSNNELNVPFILMERIEGQPLYLRWFDDEIPKASLEHFRIKILQNLAEAMAQLNKFTMDRGGALEFDSDGRPIGLAGAKVVDALATWNRGAASENQSEADQGSANKQDQIESKGRHYGNSNTAEKINSKTSRDRQEKTKEREQDSTINGDDDVDMICEKGPFECPKSALMFNLDRPNPFSESSSYIKGCYKALRMFIDMALSTSDNCGRRFVLTHPDLDLQNILVAEDGTLRGLIDWDGVASVPREIGCAQYPLWLMRDWVPFYYLYDIREGRTEDDAGYEESSPAELASYRALYALFMEKEIARQTGGPDQPTAFGTLPKQEAQLTRRSLVMRDLDLAASSPFLLTNILCHVLYQIETVTEPEWRCLDLDMDSDSDSDCNSASPSETTVESKSDANSGIDMHHRDDPGPDYTESVDDVLDGMVVAALTQQDNQEDTTMEPLMPQEASKVTDSPSQTQQPDQETHISPKECPMEAPETKIDSSSNKDLNTDYTSKPARLGWGRKLLCLGCNAAEKGLRRIAKMGHVLDDAVEQVAEVLAEVEISRPENTELPIEGKPAVEDPQSSLKASALPEKERKGDKISSQGIVEPEQSPYSKLDASESCAQTPSAQEKSDPQRASEIASVQPNIKLHDIPARKAELVRAEKARKKAEQCAKKAAIKEELKVWTDIALLVSARGVSLEQLRLNKLKIARLVVENFLPEGEEEGELAPDTDLLLADEGGEQGSLLPDKKQEDFQSKEDVHEIPESKADLQSTAIKPGSANFKKPLLSGINVGKLSSGSPAVTNTSVSVSLVKEHKDKFEPLIARPSPAQSQAGLSLHQKSRSSKHKGSPKAKKKIVTAKNDKASSEFGNDRPFSLDTPPHTSLADDHISTNQPGVPSKGDGLAGKSINLRKVVNVHDEAARAATGMDATPPLLLKSTVKSGPQAGNTSGSLRALCSFGTSCLKKITSNKSKPEDDKGSVKSDSSKDDGDNADGEESDTGHSYRSSTTSLSDEEAEFGELAEAKREGIDAIGTSVATAKHDGNTDIDICDNVEAKKAMKSMSSREQSILARDLPKKNGSKKSPLSRGVHNHSSPEAVEMSKTGKAPTAGKSAGSSGEKDGTNQNTKADCETDSEVKGNDAVDHDPENDDHSEASTDEEDSDEDNQSFEDDGDCRSRNIFTLLGMDQLDELRLLRMQEGFLKLLEQY